MCIMTCHCNEKSTVNVYCQRVMSMLIKMSNLYAVGPMNILIRRNNSG